MIAGLFKPLNQYHFSWIYCRIDEYSLDQPNLPYQILICSHLSFIISFLLFGLDFLSCRQVLNIMVILGFMLNYALRVNLTIAIVAMVDEEPADTKNQTTFSIVNNDTLASLDYHGVDELKSAAHTLPIAIELEPFQNQTNNNHVSISYII